jgi:hypothetical protein
MGVVLISPNSDSYCLMFSSRFVQKTLACIGDENGTAEEEYTYGDLNGNRTGYQRTTSNILSGYDSQDRLVRWAARSTHSTPPAR